MVREHAQSGHPSVLPLQLTTPQRGVCLGKPRQSLPHFVGCGGGQVTRYYRPRRRSRPRHQREHRHYRRGPDVTVVQTEEVLQCESEHGNRREHESGDRGEDEPAAGPTGPEFEPPARRACVQADEHRTRPYLDHRTHHGPQQDEEQAEETEQEARGPEHRVRQNSRHVCRPRHDVAPEREAGEDADTDLEEEQLEADSIREPDRAEGLLWHAHRDEPRRARRLGRSCRELRERRKPGSVEAPERGSVGPEDGAVHRLLGVILGAEGSEAGELGGTCQGKPGCIFETDVAGIAEAAESLDAEPAVVLVAEANVALRDRWAGGEHLAREREVSEAVVVHEAEAAAAHQHEVEHGNTVQPCQPPHAVRMLQRRWRGTGCHSVESPEDIEDSARQVAPQVHPPQVHPPHNGDPPAAPRVEEAAKNEEAGEDEEPRE